MKKPSGKVGRPKRYTFRSQGASYPVCAKLSEVEITALDKMASDKLYSRSEAIARAVRHFLESNGYPPEMTATNDPNQLTIDTGE